MIGSLNFIKFNFDIRLHFIHFSVFFSWRREEIVGLQFRKRKCLLVRILATKTIIFYVKWSHMTKEFKIMCFFSLITLKKNRFQLEKFFFFVSGGFWVLGCFFLCIFMVMDWFNKVSMVFWTKKWVCG